jgi:hypothetical protein
MWYEVAAVIPGSGCSRDNVGCFDPTVVVSRLKETFPEAVVRPEDLAWQAYGFFKQRGAVEGAVRSAENDARRRGPIWSFKIPTAEGRVIRGRAERYVVSIGDEEAIPGDLKSRFLRFLETLRFAPFVEVSSERIDGNDHSPA